MALVGIDFGCSEISVARARRGGGCTIVSNPFGGQFFPSVISYGSNTRSFFDHAVNQRTVRFETTVLDSKALLGRSRDLSSNGEDWFNEESQWNLPLVSEDGWLLMEHVRSPNKDGSPSDALAHVEESSVGLFQQLKRVLQEQLETKDIAAILAVPCYYSPSQRAVLLRTCVAAGLSVVGVVTEPMAVAVAYRVFRFSKEEIVAVESKKRTTANNDQESSVQRRGRRMVLFVDIGHHATQVALAEFEENEQSCIRIVASCASEVGGRDFTRSLVNYVVETAKAKHKLDLRDTAHRKAFMRVCATCEKAKCILSTNNVATCTVEAVTSDIDLSVTISRETFEKSTSSLLERMVESLTIVVSQIHPDDIEEGLVSVELFGGGARVPCVRAAVSDLCTKRSLPAPARSLNAASYVAQGAVMSGAMRKSDTFLIRPSELCDVISCDIVAGPVNSIERTSQHKWTAADLLEVRVRFARGEKARAFIEVGDEEGLTYAVVGSALPCAVPALFVLFTVSHGETRKTDEAARKSRSKRKRKSPQSDSAPSEETSVTVNDASPNKDEQASDAVVDETAKSSTEDNVVGEGTTETDCTGENGCAAASTAGEEKKGVWVVIDNGGCVAVRAQGVHVTITDGLGINPTATSSTSVSIQPTKGSLLATEHVRWEAVRSSSQSFQCSDDAAERASEMHNQLETQLYSLPPLVDEYTPSHDRQALRTCLASVRAFLHGETTGDDVNEDVEEVIDIAADPFAAERQLRKWTKNLRDAGASRTLDQKERVTHLQQRAIDLRAGAEKLHALWTTSDGTEDASEDFGKLPQRLQTCAKQAYFCANAWLRCRGVEDAFFERAHDKGDVDSAPITSELSVQEYRFKSYSDGIFASIRMQGMREENGRKRSWFDVCSIQ